MGMGGVCMGMGVGMLMGMGIVDMASPISP